MMRKRFIGVSAVAVACLALAGTANAASKKVVVAPQAKTFNPFVNSAPSTPAIESHAPGRGRGKPRDRRNNSRAFGRSHNPNR